MPAQETLPPASPQTHIYFKPAIEGVGAQPAVFQAQPLGPRDVTAPDQKGAYQIQLEPPGPERVFGHLQSEASLFEQMRQEARDRYPSERITFPEEPILSRTAYQGRAWPALRTVVEPSYVCYGKLLFEQKNFERGGWDLGAITPVVSASKFFWDFFWLPYHVGTDCFRKYECDAGYCLPDDPTPLLLYPPEWSMTGALMEIGAIATILVMFP